MNDEEFEKLVERSLEEDVATENRYGKGGTMRSLKFRAWDKKRKCYAKVIQTTNQGWKGYRDKTYVSNGIMRFSKWVLSRFIIEQYTGLKDKKNGKEIYEGDIVKYKLYADSRLDYIDEVFYSTISGAFMVGDEDNIRTLDCLINVEVIGNVHENPELLGGEDER